MATAQDLHEMDGGATQIRPRLRILYAFPEPLPLPRARGVQVMHALSALAELGDDITLSYVPVGGVLDPFAAYGLPCPANVSLMPVSRGLPWPLHGLGVHSNRLFILRLTRCIERMKRSKRCPEVIMVRHVKLGAALLDRFPNISLIYEAHEVFADTASAKQRERIGALERKLVSGAVGVVANSAATANRLKGCHGLARDILVLPNAVNVPAAVPEKDWTRLRESVIYTGSLFGWKGVADLVVAGKWLLGWRIEIIGGDAQQIEHLRAMVPDGGAEFVFRGHLPHAETLAALQRSCIAVLPNRADADSTFTSPLKLFEYLAAGCAVVATDLPAVREILGENDVVWAAAGNPKSLADAIVKLGGEPQQAMSMGAHSREIALSHTWQQRARNFRTWLNTLFNG